VPGLLPKDNGGSFKGWPSGRRSGRVFEDESVIDAAHPLLKMAKVVATPHLGCVERENYQLYYGLAIDQLLAYASGSPTHVLNPGSSGKAQIAPPFEPANLNGKECKLKR
jgi:D-3-phosphoglycerate dehydrogenase